MCFSPSASFAAAIPLVIGGAYCVHGAVSGNKKYLAMALMPLVVGGQQFIEGIVWIGVNNNQVELAHTAALFYMFFVWVFWLTWIPYMTAMLEPELQKKKLQLKWAGAGLAFGLMLYIPHLFNSGWLDPQAIQNCMGYNTVVLPDFIVPRWVTAIAYLSIIAGVPLTSSHFYLRRFGFLLMAFVPITYIFFIHAYISVLCYFAAIVTMDLIFIIVKDKCRERDISLPKEDIYVPRQETS